MKKWCLCFGLALLPWLVRADGLSDLENFVKEIKVGRADFVQVVTAPLRPGEKLARSKTSSGSFEFARPNRFRFIYTRPFEQTIVSDGQTLWLYDQDLRQITTRKLADALQGTPAAILSATDLAALQKDFSLQASAPREGVRWVHAKPRGKDAPLQQIGIGFRDGALASLEIVDNFGQRSVLSFSRFEGNPLLAADTFVFRPPPGVDVIRQ